MKIPASILVALCASILIFSAAGPGSAHADRIASQQTEGRSQKTRNEEYRDFDIRAGVERSLERVDTDRLAIGKRSIRATDGRETGLLRDRPRTQVRWSTLSYAPSRIFNLEEGLSVPSEGRPENIARRFLRDNRDLFRLQDEEINGLAVTGYDGSTHNGLTHIRFQQRISGIDIFQGEYSIHIARDGSVMAVDGELVPGAGSAINAKSSRISAEEAIKRASVSVGMEINAPMAPAGAPSGTQLKQKFRAGRESFSEDPEIRLVYFPLAGDQIRLAWETTIWMKESPDAYLMVIDATTGSLL